MNPSDYYLHVDITVPESQHQLFEQRASQFLKPQFPFEKFSKKANYSLQVALYSDPFTFKGGLTTIAGDDAFDSVDNAQKDVFLKGEEPQVRKYVHLWTVPDIADLDLAGLMRAVADDDLYMSINSLILREVQTFVRRVRIETPPGAELGQKFIRVTRRFLSKDLGTYLFNAGVLESTLRKANWLLLGQFQNVTGALNLVTEFWNIPNDANSSLKEMMKQFDDLKLKNRALYQEFVQGTLDLVQGESREPLRPTPYSPNRVSK